jgi:hypothetical protein
MQSFTKLAKANKPGLAIGFPAYVWSSYFVTKQIFLPQPRRKPRCVFQAAQLFRHESKVIEFDDLA